jgi:PHD/YefM family antitoxin component YafN of YafNO toxin-antitoxin module
MSTVLHPQYITDETGKRVSVVLPIEEYQAMTERLEDLEDLAEAREAVQRVHQGAEETIPWEAIKAEHGL